MPAVMEVPVRAVGVALDAMMANDARAMHGQHPMAASSSDKGGSGIDDRIGGINRLVVVGGIVIRVIVVVDAADKNPAEMMPVNESMAGISRNTGCGDTGRRDNGCNTNADRATTHERAAHAAAKAVATAPAAGAAATASTTAASVHAAAGIGLLAADQHCEQRQSAQHARQQRRSN